MKKVKVAEVLLGLDIEKFGGGAERFAISLSQHIDRGIFDIYVVGLWRFNTISEQIYIKNLKKLGIEVTILVDWDPKNLHKSFWNALRNLYEYNLLTQIDILHSHSQFADIAVLLMKMIRRRQIILRTVHDGHPIEWRKRPLRRILFTNFLYPLYFDAEIGVANHIVERLNKRIMAKILKKRALYIPNALDLSRFQFSENIMLSDILSFLQPSGPLVGTVGRLVEGKGYEVLLEAAKLVLERIPNVMFLLVGDGDAAKILKKKSVELGIDRKVVFVGSRLDVEILIKCMDVIVIPSFWEGLSTVALESMASGVPVIATDIPGNREIIKNLVNGILVPPGNPSKLAETIVTILYDSDLRRHLAANALRTVRLFDIKSVALKHQNLYLDLINSKFI